MKNILDFLFAALPWIAIGLFAAVTIVRLNAKTRGEDLGRFTYFFRWTPFVCFFLISIQAYSQGNSSSGTTWLILAFANLYLNGGIQITGFTGSTEKPENSDDDSIDRAGDDTDSSDDND